MPDLFDKFDIPDNDKRKLRDLVENGDAAQAEEAIHALAASLAKRNADKTRLREMGALPSQNGFRLA